MKVKMLETKVSNDTDTESIHNMLYFLHRAFQSQNLTIFKRIITYQATCNEWILKYIELYTQYNIHFFQASSYNWFFQSLAEGIISNIERTSPCSSSDHQSGHFQFPIRVYKFTFKSYKNVNG